MAATTRTNSRKRTRNVSLRYFFWDGLLHKVIRINRPNNLVTAWCYRDHKRVAILYSDYRTSAKPAVTTKKAADIMNITTRSLQRYVDDGAIKHPQTHYPLENPNSLRFSF